MIKAIIQHGSFGSPKENWFPWLKENLEKLEVNVFSPQMPSGDSQNLDNWLKEYRKILPGINNATILIGHSIAPAFFMSLLMERNQPIKGLFLVSGFLKDIGLSEYDKVNSTFYKRDFNWNKIRKLAGKIYFYSSNNDPYVPFEYQKEFADKLGTAQTIIKSGGHFNTSSGYFQFPQLLNDINKLIKNNS